MNGCCDYIHEGMLYLIQESSEFQAIIYYHFFLWLLILIVSLKLNAVITFFELNLKESGGQLCPLRPTPIAS